MTRRLVRRNGASHYATCCPCLLDSFTLHSALRRSCAPLSRDRDRMNYALDPITNLLRIAGACAPIASLKALRRGR